MTIEEMRILCNGESIQMTAHAWAKCRERRISLDTMEHCIIHGEIIENYPSDYPYPSALVLENDTGSPIHVVAGVGDGPLWIITAYRPDPRKWESDFKMRKENTK